MGPQILAQAVLAAEEEAESSSSGLDLLLPASSELWAGIIAFAVIFLVVWKWVVPTLNATLAKRQEAERTRLQEAEDAKLEAEKMAEEHRKQLAGAQTEAANIVEEARSAAEAVRSETVERAQAEAEEIVSRAREEAVAEAERALASARREVADLSLDLAEKVVGRNLDRQAQQGLVDEYLAELEAER